jgi:cytochrome c-type biogenesis protein CcsB
MIVAEGSILWGAIAGYAVAAALFLSGWVFRSERRLRWAWHVFPWAFVLHTLAIAVRWVASGHPPVAEPIEHAAAGAWFVGVVYIVAAWRRESLRPLGLAAAAVTLIMLGGGVMAENEISPLSPPFQSNWLWVHVGFAWLSWGSFVAAAGLGLFYLVKSRRASRAGTFLQRLPGPARMEDLTFRFILFGFIGQGLMIATGAIWAHGLWGSYWSWDPIETWSLISWLVYGLFLHFRLMFGMRGRTAAWYALLALITNIIYFWGIGFVPATHTQLL